MRFTKYHLFALSVVFICLTIYTAYRQDQEQMVYMADGRKVPWQVFKAYYKYKQIISKVRIEAQKPNQTIKN